MVRIIQNLLVTMCLFIRRDFAHLDAKMLAQKAEVIRLKSIFLRFSDIAPTAQFPAMISDKAEERIANGATFGSIEAVLPGRANFRARKLARSRLLALFCCIASVLPSKAPDTTSSEVAQSSKPRKTRFWFQGYLQEVLLQIFRRPSRNSTSQIRDTLVVAQG